MNPLRKFTSEVLAKVAANIITAYVIASIPIISVWLFNYFQRGQNWKLISILLAFGWSTSLLIAIMWYKNHSNWRTRRLRRLADLMIISHPPILGFITPRDDIQAAHNLKPNVVEILDILREIIAYRIGIDYKALAVVIPHNEGFQVYAQIGHSQSHRLTVEVQNNLSSDNSLEGVAISNGSLETRSDMKKEMADDGVRNLDCCLDYVGRAAIPIQPVDPDSPIETRNPGVLCFYSKKPLKLTNDEEYLLIRVADVIASLWALEFSQN